MLKLMTVFCLFYKEKLWNTAFLKFFTPIVTEITTRKEDKDERFVEESENK